MSNVKIKIEGCSSMRKSEVAEIIGKALKKEGFGKVSLTGEDDSNHYKGLISDESIQIEVIPEPLVIRDGFQGNREHAKSSYERKKVSLDKEFPSDGSYYGW
jgi:hypothetical protein